MSIEINGTRYINEEIQLCYLTIAYDGDDYRYCANTPVLEGQALQDLVDSREDRYVFGILHNAYPGARWQDSEGDTKLAKFEAWAIAHTNAAYCKGAEGDTEETCLANGGTWIPEEVITKVPFTASWSINVVTAEQEMVNDSVFHKKTPAELNSYVNANWTNLTDSKALFKKLAAEVRNIVLRQGWED